MLTIDEKEYLKIKVSMLNPNINTILFGTEIEKKIYIESEKAEEKKKIEAEIKRLQDKLKLI